MLRRRAEGGIGRGEGERGSYGERPPSGAVARLARLGAEADGVGGSVCLYFDSHCVPMMRPHSVCLLVPAVVSGSEVPTEAFQTRFTVAR